MFNIGIQLYNGRMDRSVDHEKLFDEIIKKDTYIEISKFFDIVETLYGYYDLIKQDKFGRLITDNSQISVTWEAFSYSMLPIFYKLEKIDSDLIYIFTQWYFRNIGCSHNKSFNHSSYANQFVKITNNVLKLGDKVDYCNDIKNAMSEYIDPSIKPHHYEDTLKEHEFTTIKKVTYLLYFYEMHKTTNLHTLDLAYTLEHIYPQSKLKELKDKTNNNKIGNLTLLEGSNSKNGHKGNFSLQDKEYIKKKDSYKKSSSIVTASIPQEYNTFTEATISKRTKVIAKELNKFTNYT
jgi:hypothetical protein